MPNEEEINEAKDLLTKMYLDLQSYQKDNKQTEEKKEKEKQSLKNLSLIDLINILSNYIISILEMKNNESSEEEEEIEGKPLYKQYEKLLIKAESDIRKHIKVSMHIILLKKYFN